MKEDYPVYIKWRQITGYLLESTARYPRHVRFNLCDRITNRALDVMQCIVDAIYQKQKSHILVQANRYIEQLRALLQISVDKKYISVRQYGYISEQINDAGKMIGGWIKSCGE